MNFMDIPHERKAVIREVEGLHSRASEVMHTLLEIDELYGENPQQFTSEQRSSLSLIITIFDETVCEIESFLDKLGIKSCAVPPLYKTGEPYQILLTRLRFEISGLNDAVSNFDHYLSDHEISLTCGMIECFSKICMDLEIITREMESLRDTPEGASLEGGIVSDALSDDESSKREYEGTMHMIEHIEKCISQLMTVWDGVGVEHYLSSARQRTRDAEGYLMLAYHLQHNGGQ